MGTSSSHLPASTHPPLFNHPKTRARPRSAPRPDAWLRSHRSGTVPDFAFDRLGAPECGAVPGASRDPPPRSRVAPPLPRRLTGVRARDRTANRYPNSSHSPIPCPNILAFVSSQRYRIHPETGFGIPIRPSTSRLPSPTRGASSISSPHTTETPEKLGRPHSAPPGSSRQAVSHRLSHHPSGSVSHGATPACSVGGRSLKCYDTSGRSGGRALRSVSNGLGRRVVDDGHAVRANIGALVAHLVGEGPSEFLN
jgi:hypothetical protein